MNNRWTSVVTASVLIATAGVFYYRNTARRAPAGVPVSSSETRDFRDAPNNSNPRHFHCKAFDDTGLLGIDALDLAIAGDQVTLSNISGENSPGASVTGSLDPKYHPKTNTNYVRFTVSGLVDESGDTFLLVRKDMLQSGAAQGTIKIQFSGEDFESSGYGCKSL